MMFFINLYMKVVDFHIVRLNKNMALPSHQTVLARRIQ